MKADELVEKIDTVFRLGTYDLVPNGSGNDEADIEKVRIGEMTAREFKNHTFAIADTQRDLRPFALGVAMKFSVIESDFDFASIK